MVVYLGGKVFPDNPTPFNGKDFNGFVPNESVKKLPDGDRVCFDLKTTEQKPCIGWYKVIVIVKVP